MQLAFGRDCIFSYGGSPFGMSCRPRAMLVGTRIRSAVSTNCADVEASRPTCRLCDGQNPISCYRVQTDSREAKTGSEYAETETARQLSSSQV